MKKLSKRTDVVRFRPNTQPCDVIAQRYRLTTAEKRVLAALIDSGGVRNVADALGISVATVKTHLQSIFGKTGARRQIDLVKLVIIGETSERPGQAAREQYYARG